VDEIHQTLRVKNAQNESKEGYSLCSTPRLAALVCTLSHSAYIGEAHIGAMSLVVMIQSVWFGYIAHLRGEGKEGVLYLLKFLHLRTGVGGERQHPVCRMYC
jgi:hypothetical protein